MLLAYYFLLSAYFLFYYFARTKNTLSRKEGLIFLGLYLILFSQKLFASLALLFFPFIKQKTGLVMIKFSHS